MRICLITLAWLLLGALPASAATLTESSRCYRSGCSHTAVLRGAPGERNAVTVASAGPRVTEIRDAAPVTVRGPGLCEQVDERTARCTAPERESITFEIMLGDGDDEASTDGARVYGGPGDDRLTGEAGILSGGPGSDLLTAGPTGVEFHDDDGARPAQDRYVGGDGGGTLSYAGRDDGVRIDLARGRVGPEGDVVSGVEDAVGGYGDDVVIGTAADNTLVGGRGADRIVGGAGADTIFTAIDGSFGELDRAGPDRVDAGPGRDTVHVTTRTPAGNRIDCAGGGDEVLLANRGDLVRGCETVGPGDTLQHVRVRERLARPDAEFAAARACQCREGGYVARAGRTVVARAPGRKWTVRLRLNATGRRLLAARGRLAIAVSYRGWDGPAGFRMVLRLRRSATPG